MLSRWGRRAPGSDTMRSTMWRHSARPRTAGVRRATCRTNLRRVRARGEGRGGAEEPPEVGSDAWRRRPASVRLPAGLQTPARTFAFAAVLKLILLMSSTSTYAAVMRNLGFPHAAGPLAVIRALPVWLVLAGGVALFVRSGLHKSAKAVRAAVLALVAFVGFVGYWEIKGPWATRQRLVAESRAFRARTSTTTHGRPLTPGEIIAREKMQRQKLEKQQAMGPAATSQE